jgi:hypothetical protein
VFLRVFLIARRLQASVGPHLPRSGFAWTWALLVSLGGSPLGAQEGPIRLFPDQPAPTAPAEPGPGDRPPGAFPSGPPAGPAAPTRPPQSFQVEGLPPPEVDSIGLAGASEGGFGRSLWAGSDPELILTLLSGMPVASRNPPLAALTRRLLATGASLDGATEGGRVLSARVERLLAMGDLDSAKQLLDQLPPSEGDSALARLAAEAALLAGDDAGACQRAANLAPTSDGEFWAEVVVYCRLAAGDQDGARLGLDLLREAGQTDDAVFFQLASMVADDAAGAAPPALASPQPAHLALLRLAGQPLPAQSLAALPPAALTAAAREPGLAGDHQLELAERAFRTGGLAGSDLAAIYAERTAAGNALAEVGTAWGPPARAMAYRAAREVQTPADLATLLDATWRAASGDERFLVAEALAGRFAELPVDRAWSVIAPSAARGLLAADRPLPAARWFSLLEAERASDSGTRRELASLTPLFALAGIGGSDAVPELDEAAVAAWRAATPDADAKAERLFALLDGVGSPVSDRVWWQELEPPFERAASIPASPLWRGLERAVAGKRLGETVLFALNMLNGQPETAHPVALTGALRALRAAGLDREARAIAVATALVMDL